MSLVFKSPSPFVCVSDVFVSLRVSLPLSTSYLHVCPCLSCVFSLAIMFSVFVAYLCPCLISSFYFPIAMSSVCVLVCVFPVLLWHSRVLCSACSVCFLLTCYYVYSSQLCCPCASFSLVTLLCIPVCMNSHAFIVKSSVMFMPCYQGFMLPGIYKFSPGLWFFMFTFLFPQFRFLFSVVLVCLALCFILFIKHNKCLTFS